MDKIWLSPQEKRRYLQIYSKLLKNNYLQKDKLVKFVINRATIGAQQAKIITQKSFLVSKESETIDQVGFFYLMKYVAYIQSGGSEKDDITTIQRDLNLPTITESKKSSEGSEKPTQNTKKSSRNQNSTNQIKGDDEEEEQKSSTNQSQISSDINLSQYKSQNEDKNFLQNLSQLSDLQQENSHLEKQINSDINKSQNELAQQLNNSKIENSQNDLSSVIQNNGQAEKLEEKKEEEIGEEEEEQKQANENEEIQKNQNKNGLSINNVIEEKDISEQVEDQIVDIPLNKSVNQQRYNTLPSANGNATEFLLPDFESSKLRAMTFGSGELQQLQQFLENEKKNDQQDEVKLYDDSQASFGLNQNKIELNQQGSGVSLQLGSQIQNQSQFNQLPGEENVLSAQFANQQNEIVDLLPSFKVDDQNQFNANPFFGNEEQVPYFSQLQNPMPFKQLSNQRVESEFYVQELPNNQNDDKFDDKTIPSFLNELNSNNLNNKYSVDSIYEMKEVKPVNNFNNNNGQQQSGLNKQNNNSNVAQKYLQQAYNDEEEEDKQLIKSVMECQEFSKDAQNQIKNALDIFKSTREENQLNKSRIKKDKLNKSVRILGYRNEQENIIRKYILFQIETQVEGKKCYVERRYNHFRTLHDYFENSVDYYGIIKPTLPSKNMTTLGSYLGSQYMDQQTLEQRKIDLENYLNLYLQNEILKNDKVLINFLEEKEFIMPVGTQFSYIEWMKNMVTQVQNTDFQELKEYTEAMMKITLTDFFKMGDNEIDTKEIDIKMEQVRMMGNQIVQVINFMNEDIKYDTEQQIAIEVLEKNFYTEYDQRENSQEKQRDSLQDTLKKFKSETLDLSLKIKSEVQEKVKVLQEFRIIHNSIESAKVAQQVLKNKIQERFILKKMKVSKFNKVHEQNNNKSDSSEAKRELDRISERFKKSEEIITSIQSKLSRELSTFIDIQKQKIANTLQLFSKMHQSTLYKASHEDYRQHQEFNLENI